MPIDSRERIGPAVAAVVTDVGHESAHRMEFYHHPERYLIAEEEADG